MTFTPQFNVYADKNGVATHKSEGNTLAIAAGSPVALEEAERLKLPELEALAMQKAAMPATDAALKPAAISVSDAKLIEEADKEDKAAATAKNNTAPTTVQGS